MTRGYVSDVPGDDTVMDTPTVSVFIRLSELPPAQALATIQEVGPGECEVTDEQLGALARGEDVTDELGDATIHLPIGPALTALSSIGVVNLPDDPSEVDIDTEENQQG